MMTYWLSWMSFSDFHGVIHAVPRSVRDSAVLLDATAGPDAGQTSSSGVPAVPWFNAISLLQALSAQLAVAVLSAIFSSPSSLEVGF